jgi:hypothetical protein
MKKQKKSKTLQVRITEEQFKNLLEYIGNHPEEFKNHSQLIRESLLEKFSRKKLIDSKNKLVTKKWGL